ncbi:AppA family phytase/histidine-type acid phosphatase [Candidatus Hamiltonella defensa]|uniref:AppA family phytase/histidine-type acid phosphatase n=1 Tax=Candidatus Williamhamiltonella defendens TaxID=138072 RepID=UPI000C1F4B91
MSDINRIVYLTILLISFPLHAQHFSGLTLESVVIVSRHGVRAPTKFTPLMQRVTPNKWPVWEVPYGWMTPRGGQLVSFMGRYQHLRLVNEGLFREGKCPTKNEVSVLADIDQRTRKTGEAFLSGFMPSCSLPIHNPLIFNKKVPLFNPIKAGICHMDEGHVKLAVLMRAGGSLEHFTQKNQPAFSVLENVLNFAHSDFCKNNPPGKSCTLINALPAGLQVHRDNVSLSGAPGLASMLTEIFLLQQAQGMSHVAWGKISSREEWDQLLSLHNAQFDLLQRMPYIARHRATPLLDLILMALTPGNKGKNVDGITLPASLLFIAGHDTNIANIGGALGMKWQLSGQPDNTPPGGELVFERWVRVSDNTQWIKISIVYQTLEQMRNMSQLSLENPPVQVNLALPACEEQNEQQMCSLKSVQKIIQSVRIPECSICSKHH